MTDFAQAFQNDHKNIDAVNEIGTQLSRLVAQSHMIFSMRMEEFILYIYFNSSLCAFFIIGWKG